MTILAFVLATAPILLVFLLMVGYHFSSAKAGFAGYLLCLFLSAFFFGGNVVIIMFSHIKALFLSLDVLLIIWAAFLFYMIIEEAGAIRLMTEHLPLVASSKSLQAMLLGWIFASFLQGVGGFGVPVAVLAPVLVQMGFSPYQAVLIPSVGHGWAVTFGSLGSSFRALLATTGQPIEPLGFMSAFLLGVSAVVCGFMVLYLVEGWKAIRTEGFLGLGIGLIMGVTLILAVGGGLWNLASFLAATSGLFFAFVIAYLKNHHRIQKDTLQSLWQSFTAYLILVVVIFVVQFIEPVRMALNSFRLAAAVPELETSGNLLGLPGFVTPAETVGNINLFGHPGVVLFYACLLSFGYFFVRKTYASGALSRIMEGTIQRLIPTTISVTSMVAMAVMMENTGMSTVLANTLANLFHQAYPIIAPWLGAVGAFVTGSNTNSNVLFGLLQLRTAQRLSLPAFIILAGQTAGASLASTLAPAKIVVGTSTTGLVGKEGLILKKLFPFVIIEVLLISIMVYFGVQIQSWQR